MFMIMQCNILNLMGIKLIKAVLASVLLFISVLKFSYVTWYYIPPSMCISNSIILSSKNKIWFTRGVSKEISTS